jgi:uncharacterized RDD family membrane protein YckC
MVYDGLLLLGLWFVATALLLVFRRGQALPPGHWAYSAYLLGVSFAFFGWFWTHGGQTLGMRAWKIALRNNRPGPLTWRQAAIRFAAALLSLGLFGLGYVWVLVDPEKRSWHDRLSHTRLERV